MVAYRVLTGTLSHETNTFCRVPTDLDSFRRGSLLGANEIPAAYTGTRTGLGATFEAAERFGWTLVHPIAAAANPSGFVTTDAYETLVAPFLAAADGIDGALLHLHGAMVTEAHEDGEGELLRRLRARIGHDVPIVVILDLHANVTEAMATHANALIAVRTYPHIDFYERAWQGAELLERAMRGEIRPCTVLARRPMLRGLDGGRTQTGPMRELIDRGDALEREGAALVVSVCAGFTAADIHEIGPSVTVTTDGASEAGREIAETFMDHAWATRSFASVRHLAVEDAVARAKAPPPDGDARPLVLADVTDNPGSGHYGDATNLLRAMIAADLPNAAFYALFDPAAVQDGIALGVGREGTITMGGKHDPDAGGPPLALTGRVVAITDGHFQTFGPMGGGVWKDYGLSMLFRIGGIDIVVISNNGQAIDLAQLTSLGIDPTRKTTIAVKSAHHFRAAFTPIAREILTVNGGGLGAVILDRGGYTRVRRPIWPLDPDVSAP